MPAAVLNFQDERRWNEGMNMEEAKERGMMGVSPYCFTGVSRGRTHIHTKKMHG